MYINKFNIKDGKLLVEVEADLMTNKLTELIDNPVDGIFDIDHISRIHEYIFQDLYPFSDKIRMEEIWKDVINV